MTNFLKNYTTEKNKGDKQAKASLLNGIGEGLIVSDEGGDIIYCNDIAKEIIEQGLFGPIDIVSRNSKRINFKGHCYEARYSRLPESAGIKGMVATLVDTLEQEDLAKEVSRLREELNRARSFKSSFFANMSHEIRTPIHAIVGFAELLNKEDIPEGVKAKIDMIKDSSYSLLAIINDILDLSKLETGKLELVCSNYYFSYVIRDLEATYSLEAARKGLKFEIHLDNNIPSYIYGDKIRIRGTLINVLNNAIKFTKEGRVDFFIHVLEKRDGVATFQFVVKDTGVGIKKEDVGKVFESFSKFDINNNYAVEGRGLGLSIAKGYMDLMGGRIEVKSEYGVGSTFTVTVDQKIVDDSPIDMEIVNARKKKKKSGRMMIKDTSVLVVDDNPINLSVADGLMKAYGLNVQRASGGREAIDSCMKNTYDIIFMDQMMPEIDGIMAMKQIRKISEFYEKQCKIIVLTADAMAGVKEKLLSDGFDEYLCKPLEVHQLERVLHTFIPKEDVEILNNDSIVIEQAEGNTDSGEAKLEDLNALAKGLGIKREILDKKIKDCGGTLDEYIEICRLADKNAASRIEKLKESLASKNYERYTIEIHSIKFQMASLGAMELAERAKKQETACMEGKYYFVEEDIDSFLAEYKNLIGKIRKYVLKIEEEVTLEAVEEWSCEDIMKVCKRISTLVEEFDFGAILDLLSDIKKMEMGSKTKELFLEFEEIANAMDISRLRSKLREYL